MDGNLEKPSMSLYGTEWIERGYGLWILPERDKCKPVLLRLSLAVNLEKPLMSLYGTEWGDRGYGLRLQAHGLRDSINPWIVFMS